MSLVDLDKARAARHETNPTKPVRLGGRDWDFKPEVPLSIMDKVTAGEFTDAVGLLLVDVNDVDEFFDIAAPSVDDLEALLDQVYGLGLGESSASPGN